MPEPWSREWLTRMMQDLRENDHLTNEQCADAILAALPQHPLIAAALEWDRTMRELRRTQDAPGSEFPYGRARAVTLALDAQGKANGALLAEVAAMRAEGRG